MLYYFNAYYRVGKQQIIDVVLRWLDQRLVGAVSASRAAALNSILRHACLVGANR